MISLISAMDRNNTIGRNNKLPWHLPEDLAYFKKITSGHTVIMGRKTFESIGKPLPNRNNIVLSRKLDFFAEGCIVFSSVEECLKYVGEDEAFVIGGAEIYKEFLPFSRKLYITLIDEIFEGDAFFPEIDYSEWRVLSKVEGVAERNNMFRYWFLQYGKL